MAQAELARFVDRHTVEYLRVYGHPIERVWRAVTDPAEFAVWFEPGRIDPRPGGAYHFGCQDSGFDGVVLAIEPPRLIRFGEPANPRGYFQYELSEVAEGTRMRFTQYFPLGVVPAEAPDDTGAVWRPGLAEGWHEHWDALGDFLDGAPCGSRLPPTKFGQLAASWAREMVHAGVFTIDEAARHALSLRRHEASYALNEIYREHIKRALPPAV